MGEKIWEEKMTLNQAWNKTIKKWEILIENPNRSEPECGLCLLFTDMWHQNCTRCPLLIFDVRCIDDRSPYMNYMRNHTKEGAELMYMFLLLVREATKWHYPNY